MASRSPRTRRRSLLLGDRIKKFLWATAGSRRSEAHDLGFLSRGSWRASPAIRRWRRPASSGHRMFGLRCADFFEFHVRARHERLSFTNAGPATEFRNAKQGAHVVRRVGPVEADINTGPETPSFWKGRAAPGRRAFLSSRTSSTLSRKFGQTARSPYSAQISSNIWWIVFFGNIELPTFTPGAGSFFSHGISAPFFVSERGTMAPR